MTKQKEQTRKDIIEEMEEGINVFFRKMDKLIEKEWGKKCRTYLWNCCLCRMWDVYDRFKRDLELEYLRK